MSDLIVDTTGLLLMIAFLAFFFGYAIGRRQGKREGFTEGVRYAPLEMRRQTWEKGHCVICGARSAEGMSKRRAEAAGEELPREERT